jgi:hypothetical protein
MFLLANASVGGAGQRPAGASPIFVIVLENREYDEVFDSPEAPYLSSLARRELRATRYYAVAHPSLPNYLALLGGSTFGIDDDCTECTVAGDNLSLQLSRAGISWRAYMGDMPRPCFRGAESGRYVKRHNPFMYFPSITDSRERCLRVVPASRLELDLRRHSLPSFGWLSPDLCRDAHDCEIADADRYLAALVPRIVRAMGPAGTLVITFDEGTGEGACCQPSPHGGGGRVLTVVASQDRSDVHRTAATFSHYSLLAAIERHFGLPRLRAARQATMLPLRAPDSSAFRQADRER